MSVARTTRARLSTAQLSGDAFDNRPGDERQRVVPERQILEKGALSEPATRTIAQAMWQSQSPFIGAHARAILPQTRTTIATDTQ